MAERTLAVRLVALVDQYKAAMAGAAKSTDMVTQAGARVQQVGSKIAGVGDNLTRRVTLPLVALGGVATVMAANFDNTFTKMQTLAGLSADEVDGLKDSVLNLAGETGKAPEELAEALYFLRSSGLDSAASLDALEVSAKASAAGMGSTIDIANAVSSAMNAYAKSGLSAAEATDVLVATAREGKAEPAELAAQMGRVLPIASELGVTFQDVGASIAALSLSGNDAAASTTQLTNLLSKIVKPSQQAAEQLESVGLSVEDLRGMIKEKGLLGTLEELRAQLGDAGFTKFLEDQQAVLAGLALTGENVEKNREIFDELSNSTGALDNAFSTWAESMGAKNARAFAELQVAAIRFGESIAPVVSSLLSLLADLVSAFAHLPKGVQEAIIVFLAFAAALGPIMSAGGRVIQVVGGIIKAYSTFAQSLTNAAAAAMNQGTALQTATVGMSRIGSVATGAAIGLGVLGAAFVAIELIMAANERAANDWADAITEDVDTSSLRSVRDALSEANDELKELAENQGDRGIFHGTPLALLTTGERDEERIKALKDNIAELEDQEKSLVDQEQQTAAAFVGTDSALEGLNEETANAVNALQDYSDALKAQFDPLFGMVDALQGNRDAQAEVTAAQQALNDAVAEFGPNSAEAADAQARLDEARRSGVDSALALETATAELIAGVEAGTVSQEGAIAVLKDWADRGLIDSGTLQWAMGQISGAMDHAGDRAKALDRTDPNVNVTTSGVPIVRGEIDALMATLHSSRWNWSVAVDFRTGDVSSVPMLSPFGPRQHGGPVAAGHIYKVGEAGEELFVSDTPGRIIPNHEISSFLRSTRGSAMSGVAMSGGGSATMVAPQFNFYGPVGSQAEAERWVSEAWNRGVERNLINVRGRRL